MIQRISKAFVGLVLLLIVASPSLVAAPTHNISAEAFGLSEYRPDLSAIYLSADHQSVKGIASDTNIAVVVDPATTGVSGGALTASVALCKGNVIHHNNRDCIYGMASGTAFSNGHQINYFATVTITGGDERYTGATGSFSLNVYQNGIQDLGNIALQIPSEFVLDGQYSLQ
jgi:hypothetical protein